MQGTQGTLSPRGPSAAIFQGPRLSWEWRWAGPAALCPPAPSASMEMGGEHRQSPPSLRVAWPPGPWVFGLPVVSGLLSSLLSVVLGQRLLSPLCLGLLPGDGPAPPTVFCSQGPCGGHNKDPRGICTLTSQEPAALGSHPGRSFPSGAPCHHRALTRGRREGHGGR